jgi:hypothetical protein
MPHYDDNLFYLANSEKYWLYVQKSRFEETVPQEKRHLYHANGYGYYTLRDSIIWNIEKDKAVLKPPIEIYKQLGKIWILKTHLKTYHS